MAEPLPSWNDGPAKAAIARLRRARHDGGDGRAAGRAHRGLRQRRHALVREADADRGRVHPAAAAEMAEADAGPARRQPWKAAYERDYAWLGGAMVKHYAGDDTDVSCCSAACSARSRAWTVEAYDDEADAFLRTAQHPTLGRGYRDCGYRRWSSCCGTWRRTGSPTTSPRAATATSCGRSPRRSTASRRSG